MLNLWLRGAALLFVGVALSFFLILMDATLPFWSEKGIAPLAGAEWYPYEGLYGFAPAIVGSVWSALIATAIALPTGVAAALVCDQFFCPRHGAFLRLMIEALAGVPSVIYGLLGLALLAPWLQSTFGTLTGQTLLAAGLLLAMMILPTLMLMALDAFGAIPVEQQEGAKSLGMEWSERLFAIMLPQAWPGIRSGLLLAIGRALGETMAVMLVVGSMERLPTPWYNLLTPAQTLTSRIGREIGEASLGSLHFSALMSCGLLLAIATITLSLIAHFPFARRLS